MENPAIEPFAVQSLTLHPIYDTYYSSSNATTNYANTNTVIMGSTRYNSVESVGAYQFDLSALKGGSLSSASFQVQKTAGGIGRFIEVVIGKVPYTKATTYNAQYAADPSVLDLGKGHGQVFDIGKSSANSEFINWDMTAIIKYIMTNNLWDHAIFFRFASHTVTTFQSYTFASSEHTTEAYRPKLVVSYTPSPHVSVTVEQLEGSETKAMPPTNRPTEQVTALTNWDASGHATSVSSTQSTIQLSSITPVFGAYVPDTSGIDDVNKIERVTMRFFPYYSRGLTGGGMTYTLRARYYPKQKDSLTSIAANALSSVYQDIPIHVASSIQQWTEIDITNVAKAAWTLSREYPIVLELLDPDSIITIHAIEQTGVSNYTPTTFDYLLAIPEPVKAHVFPPVAESTQEALDPLIEAQAMLDATLVAETATQFIGMMAPVVHVAKGAHVDSLISTLMQEMNDPRIQATRNVHLHSTIPWNVTEALEAFVSTEATVHVSIVASTSTQAIESMHPRITTIRAVTMQAEVAHLTQEGNAPDILLYKELVIRVPGAIQHVSTEAPHVHSTATQAMHPSVATQTVKGNAPAVAISIETRPKQADTAMESIVPSLTTTWNVFVQIEPSTSVIQADEPTIRTVAHVQLAVSRLERVFLESMPPYQRTQVTQDFPYHVRVLTQASHATMEYHPTHATAHYQKRSIALVDTRN